MEKLNIDVPKICQGYEDEDHPCFNCFIKGVCSNNCQGIWDYEKGLRKVADKLGHAVIPKPFTKKFLRIGAKTIEYSIKDIMDYLKAIEGKKVVGLLKDEEVVAFIKNAQYTINRQQFIMKNYMARNPNIGTGSTSSSSVSSSAISSTLSSVMKFNRNKKIATYFRPPKKLNQHLVRQNV